MTSNDFHPHIIHINIDEQEQLKMAIAAKNYRSE